MGAGKARRIDAGLAVQRVNLNPRIIGKSKIPRGVRNRPRFFDSVLFERLPVFVNLRRIEEFRQRMPTDARGAQELSQLTNLMGVACGNDDVQHRKDRGLQLLH